MVPKLNKPLNDSEEAESTVSIDEPLNMTSRS